jgi:hypothetical protein
VAFTRSDHTDTEEMTIPDKKLEVNDSTQGYKSSPNPLDSIEFYEVLESNVSLEAPKVRYITVPGLSPLVLPADERSQSLAEIATRPTIPATEKPLDNQPEKPNQLDKIVIPLWDERLIIDRHNRKVGEVVVRKVVETQIVEIPVRRERLIVEQLSPEYQQIAVVELGQVQVSDLTVSELIDSHHATLAEDSPYPTVSGEFATTSSAIQFLEAIANGSHSSLQKIKISIALKDVEQQSTYQQWIEFYSTEGTPSV